MKALVIIYKGETPSESEISSGLLSLGILPENATVRYIPDEELRSIQLVSGHVAKVFVPATSSVLHDEEPLADDAANVVIRISNGMSEASLAKAIIPAFDRYNTGNFDADDANEELVKACRILTSGRKVSNAWLKEHGLTRRDFEKAKAFINDIIA